MLPRACRLLLFVLGTAGVGLAGAVPVSSADAEPLPIVVDLPDTSNDRRVQQSRAGDSMRGREQRPAEARAVELRVASEAEIEQIMLHGRRQEIEARAFDRRDDLRVADDPLRTLARSLVNVERRSAVEAEAGQPASRAEPKSRSPERDLPPMELDDELRAMSQGIKATVAEVVRETIKPRMDEAGRVSFSIAGVDDIHLSSDGREIRLGVGDTTFGSLSRGQAPAGGSQAQLRHQNPEWNENNPVRWLINLFFRIIDHPLTWLALAVLMLGWFVVAVVSMQSRRSGH